MARVVVVVEPSDDHRIVSTVSRQYGVADQAALDVYRGVLMDLCRAAAGSNADLAVAAPAGDVRAPDARALLQDAIGASADGAVLEYDPARGPRPDDVAAEEGAVTLLLPRSPLIRRTHLDSAAMRLRRHDTVIGPTARGGVCHLSVSESATDQLGGRVDDLEAVVDAAVADDASVDLLAPWPAMDSEEGLAGTLALLAAFQTIEREIAPYTRAALAGIDGRFQ